jgi:L-alanine-DL-glutamate epimerase-like enolase superfamily enzyme
MRTAWGELRERRVLILAVEGRDGVRGYGEAAPLEPYDGVPLSIAREALERYRPLLEDGDDARGGELLDACRQAADLPQALSAVDLALWDRAGRREGRTVVEMITDDPADSIAVNATIGATDRAHAASEAAAAVEAGFGCVKLKVGVGDDAGRVAAVRAAAGPHVDLRLDANGAWEVEEAVRMIEALSGAGLELVEEPVHGIAALREVRERVPVRIGMDETAELDGALFSAAADAICLKIGRCGGISGTLAAAALVRASGAGVYIASTFDGPLGIAAALHVAAAVRPDAACGLATLGLFDGMENALPVRNGVLRVPSAPGLGVEPRPAGG